MWWLVGAAAWMAIAVPVAVVIGKGIKHADRREFPWRVDG